MGLSLRPATEGDSERLLEWRNDPQTREMAVVQAAVARATHMRWLAARLGAADTLLTIAEEDGVPVGTVRLDRHGSGEAELSITIAPAARGRGLARPAIELGVEHARREWGVEHVTARIRPENAPSLRAFAAAGFERVREEGDLVVVTAATRTG
ncbi:MAG TPA: GNAT family N-acetyltransferase [Solirubrobacteraceae bacterium]|nr:GNAT family N-acetyltransferase [Solirubrobacteraceae bacterium]